ncbi:hypothetical protein L484_005000 [Morus notabilis]|uniref:Uncharacterized protein n=1 Tax=Morus notabilis TaxID=981085 RepID=W9SHC0_9ROSA|nr:hypothetical protein L484_005000 [Morus notabilis]
MVGQVVTCAGSSGGAQPPLGPHRVPAFCEFGIGRGGAKGYEITQKVLQDGKITVEFDEAGGTWKAFGKYGAWFESAVGIHTKDICEPFHDAWKDISDMDKRTIQNWMLNTLEEERQTQRTQSISSSTRPAFDEHGVLEQVLGMHRGQKIGVGPMFS